MAPTPTPKFLAATALIGRTGSEQLQIRYQDDDTPTVWVAVSKHGSTFKVGVGLDPEQATLDLCERLVDGGICTHCRRVTVFLPVRSKSDAEYFPGTCCYGWNPHLKSFERSCGAETN